MWLRNKKRKKIFWFGATPIVILKVYFWLCA